MKIKRVIKRSLVLILVVFVGWIFIAYWTSTTADAAFLRELHV